MDNDKGTKKQLLQVINETPASQLPNVPEVAERFKNLYRIIHGKSAKVDAFYESEKFHFMKLVNDTAALSECTKLSLYGCLLDVAVSGLSFDSSFKHLYLVPFSSNVGTRQTPKWEKRAQLQISGYGELVLRIKQGQIKYVDNPVLVYAGDKFRYGTKGGSSFVEHEAVLPKSSNVIVACYMKIVRIDKSIDFKIITTDDIVRFKAYAKRDKDGNLSKAWTDGEGGMWINKCIKHAFKNYPKIRLGKFSQLDTEIEETETVIEESSTMRVPDDITYFAESTTVEVLEREDTANRNSVVEVEEVEEVDNAPLKSNQKVVTVIDDF